MNEQATIHGLLDAIGKQGYPLDRLETIVADGGSTDGTRQVIAAYQAMHPEHTVILVENPARIIPAGLNRAISASTGEILMRLDGHSSPAPGYLDACVNMLEEGKGDMVGGGLEVVSRDDSWFARSIVAAVSHPVGVGDSHFRFSTQAQEVDTIAFCAFRKDWIERVGGYDETLLANEDYEFNSRVRKAGGRIWLDPSYRTRYYPPATFGGLRRQYWRYGYWKARMAKRFPETLRWRQFLPPAALAVAVLAVLTGIVFHPIWIGVAFFAILYAGLLALVGIGQAIRHHSPSMVVGVPLAIATMHSNWAAAFLWSWSRKD